MAEQIEVDVAALRAVAEELYAGPAEEFVATRTAAVKRLRGEGDRATATAVGELRRPTQAAWAVNRLVRERGDLVAELLELGSALREAQSSLDAETLRGLTRQRRQVVAQVGREAAAVADEVGVALGAASQRQVEDTLQAALVSEELADALATGLLVQPLSSTGVESLADVQAIPGAPRLEVVRRTEPASAQPVADEQDEGDDGAEARRRAEEREAAEARAAQEERQRTRERTRLRKERDAERTALGSAERDADRLEREVESARKALATAETDLRRAQERREQVERKLAALEERLAELG